MATTKQIKAVNEIESKYVLFGKNKIVYEPTKSSIGYIYIIQCHNFYKIGKTFDIEKRLSQLQVGNPYKLEMLRYIKIPEHEYAEYVLQTILFKEKWERGEWFKLDDADLIILKKALDEFEKQSSIKD